MDIHKILNSVKTLNDYIAATENIVYKCPNLKIHLNMSTVLNLKKVRSLEIEYFNKCEDNGAAFVVFERLLKQPPSKTWGLLGKELISMMQYWLDAVRRHLISHSHHWWAFLKALLRFIKEIKSKDPSLLSIIVEQTTECLLDIACNSRLDEIQRHEVLQTVNEFCSESSRELRSRLKEQLSGYFVKLGTILASSGHLPTQVGILEALLRWLLGRYDPQVRRNAADAWFPSQLFKTETVELFLERSWRDFYQDARDFLNSHNADCPERVTSVVCKKLTVGGVDIINGPQSRVTWLDVNAASRSVTVILDPRVLESIAATSYTSYETLTLQEHDVSAVQLYRAAGSAVVWLQTPEPVRLRGGGAGRGAAAAVRARSLALLDRALARVFQHKYQLLLNLDTLSSSPSSVQDNLINTNPRKLSSSEEDRRSAIPVRRRKHSGYIVRSRNPAPWNSPSTASTSSLAQLHDKLAALPHVIYNKEPIKVSIQPELSMVREVSECDDRSSILSNTSRSRRFGVCQRQSDGEGHVNTKRRNISPVYRNNDKPVSLMLAATLGSADQSIISDTYEKLQRDNGEIDLLDLLVKEAFQNGHEKDSGIIIDKKTQDSEIIENTPLEQQGKQVRLRKLTRSRKAKCTVVSNSTTDESNTEIVNETHGFVSERKKIVATKKKDLPKNTEIPPAPAPAVFEAAAIDAFFSQHIAENDAGRLVVSPTLAKKINETSSECSENIINEELNIKDPVIEVEIIDFLNDVVDEVCTKFHKCTESLSKERQEQDEIDILTIAQNTSINNAIVNQSSKDTMLDVLKENDLVSNEESRKVTLKFQPAKKRVAKKNTKPKKPKEVKVSDEIMAEEDNVFIENANAKSPINKCNTPLTRKKRKLYSPKDDDNGAMDDVLKPKVYSKQSNVNKTPIAACYKEIEMERKSASRIPRKLRSSTEPPTSPRTKRQNDVFDKLKERVDNEEKITLVNRKTNKKDVTVYNFPSESEDEDFKQKKNEVQKRVSSTSLRSTVSKRGRVASRINYTESNNSSADESKKKPKKRKVVKQSKPRSRKVIVEPCHDLVDERMRETAPEVLDTSFVKETVEETTVQEPEPAIEKVSTMEMITEDTHDDAPGDVILPEIKAQRRKRPNALKLKKEKNLNKTVEKSAEKLTIKKEKAVEKSESNEQNGAESPLPGLVIETEKSRLDDITASVEANMLQRFKKIYTEGPDVDESDVTQSLLLRADKNNSPEGSNNDINLDVFDEFEKIDNISANKDFALVDPNQNRQPKKVDLDTIVLSDVPSEKSIATDGKSPITGHNDLDESPPNMELLEEKISERDLEIQDMNQTMAEFFIQLRNGLQVDKTPKASSEKSKASPVLQLTRLYSKECAKSPKSNVSSPKVVLSRISSKVLEICATPKKSKSSSSIQSPEVVLERISSDDINKWLPMPPIKREYSYEEKPKKYDTRSSKQKLVGVVKKTPERQVKSKFKSIISPIKLSFDNDEIKLSSYSANKENHNESTLNKTRTRSVMSRELSISVDKVDPPKTKTQKSLGTEIVNFFTKRNVIKPSSSGSVHKSSIGEVRQEIDDAPVPVVGEDVRCNIESDNASGGSQSAASVNEWFKRNVAPRSSSKADTNLARDIVGKVLETLDTTLEEIQQSTSKRLALMFLDNQRRLSRLHEESRELDKRTMAEIMAVVQEKWAERDRKLQEMVEDFEKVQRQRACEVSKADRERTTLMVRLLKEDLQAILDFTDRQNK